MFELGVSVGSMNANGREGLGAFTTHLNVRPPNPSLSRFTFGGEFPNLWHGGTKDTAMPSGNPVQNWKALASYDYLVIPQGFGGMAFSAGYEFGRYHMEQLSPDGFQSLYTGASYEHFITLNWRWLMEIGIISNKKSEDNSASEGFFTIFKISTKGTKEFGMGYAIGFGKKASVRVKVEK